jgi:proton-dependent oligopeptide transporter, POT family
LHPFSIMGVAWLGVIVWIGLVIYMNRKVHPSALFFLFFAEFWERFSYYGMRALLVLYMVNEMDFTDTRAYGVYAAYGAMVYATPIAGGLLAEKAMGYRKAIIWGGLLMALGHFAMAFEPAFYVALSLLILGNGFFKPNISSFIATFYEKNDPRKDGAYTLFYMGINAGAFLTPLTCGMIGQHPDWGWHYGFGLAGVGMVLGLMVFLYGAATGVFEDKGGTPGVTWEEGGGKVGQKDVVVAVASLAAIPIIVGLIINNGILDIGLSLLGLGCLAYLGFAGYTEEKREDGQRLWVVGTLLLFTTLFWTFFELAGSAITLYTDRNVDRMMFGMELPASVFQSVNPFFIILLAPAFSAMWVRLGNKGIEPPAPIKFALGLFLLGLGFLVFPLGAGAASAGMVPVMYLILAYLMHTLGELCLSPVGLSLVTKLAPTRIVGLIMGIWFISSSLAHQAGKVIANMTAGGGAHGGEDIILPAGESLAVYTDVFTNVGLVAVGASVFLLAISPILKKMMHGVR